MRYSAAFRALVLAGLVAVAAAGPVRADSGPVFVVPSRPGIPIIINGRDASYAVVEGDWGLARPRYSPIVVIGGAPVAPTSVYNQRYSYHPSYGVARVLGRREIEPPPNYKPPQPTETFSRTWSSSSEPQPVRDAPRQLPYRAESINPPGGDRVSPTVIDQQTYPQDFSPSIIVDQRRQRRHN